jgi:Holliday junction resolvase RusA-like endonuclease
MNIPVTPVPKPRMVRSDKWNKRPATKRYWDFKDELHKHVKGNLEPTFTVTFNIPMPKSWTKTRRARCDRLPHQQRPDVDNYLKAFMDCLCEDDSYIFDVRARKFWAVKGSIDLEEWEYNGEKTSIL